MKIESVTARAFGPFSGDVLQLAPGMNVIYGPNESGKSSWHAAIYAAICGMRRARGRARVEDQLFIARHRPWRGRAWHVSAWVVLDDGVQLEIDQRLGVGGRSTVLDRKTKLPLAMDIERDGAADASTLLGLSRETAAATMFVRQDEILKVLGGAEALQEYLERAAATASVDTTADEALTALDSLKKDRVGLLRSNSRSPIALAHRRLEDARRDLDTAEERFESYQALRARLTELAGELQEAESNLAEVDHHEKERARRERWRGISDLERQLEAARGLQEELDSAPFEPEPDAGVIEAITGALDSLTRLPPIPPEADGPTVEQLRDELDQLPDRPVGDLEAAEAVTEAIDSWRTAGSLLMSHRQGTPKLDDAATAEPSRTDSEIEKLESELAGLPSVPEGDLEPAAAVAETLDHWGRSAASLETHLEGRPEIPASIEQEDGDGPTAEDLEAELAQLPIPPDGDQEPADTVGQLLTAWREACAGLEAHADGRPTVPDPGGPSKAPEGQSAAELQALLSTLPARPDGDIEPALDAQSAFESWRRADERAFAHVEARPESEKTVKLPAPAGDLRRLLDDLTAPVPDPEPALAAEIARRQSQGRTATAPASRGLLIGGILVAVLGVVMFAAVQPVVGGVILALGLVITVFGLTRRPRLVAPTGAADPELAQVEAELVRQMASRREVLARAERASTALAGFGLPPDPTEVHRLIATSERRATIEAIVAAWQRRDEDVRKALSDVALRLGDELARRGVLVVEGGDLHAGYDRYVGSCRERAALARQAERRDELQSLLHARLAVEAGEHRRLVEAQEAVENWERRRAKLEQASEDAAGSLRQELGMRGVTVEKGADLQDGYDRYVVECRERARVARQAERRGELQSLLEVRRALEQRARQRQAEAHALVAGWERRRTELEGALGAAAGRVHAELESRCVGLGEDKDLRAWYDRYVDKCQERAGVARRAGRRQELETLLDAQREVQHGALQRLIETQARLDNWQQRLNDLEEDLSKCNRRLRAELSARGMAGAEGDDLQAIFERYVGECRARAGVARQAERRAELRTLLDAREAAERSHKQVLAAHQQVRRTIDAHAEATGSAGTTLVEKVAQLRRWVEVQHSKEAARARGREVQASLRELLDGVSLDERARELHTKIASAGSRPDHLDDLPDRATEASAKAGRARDLRDQTAQLAGQLEEAEAHLMDVAVALEDEQRAQDEADNLAALAEDLDLTAELLKVAKDKAHANIAPVLNQTLRPWIPRVTDGRYDDVRIDSTTLELNVRETGGQFHPATNLSHGTAEQLFLLLRIGLAEHLATGDEVAPLILDDVTVQADTKRTRAMLDLIHELSAARQVVLFSQEDEVLAWAQAALHADADRLIELASAGA